MAAEEKPLVWKTQPLKENGWKTAFLLLFLLFFLRVIYFSFGNTLYVIVAAILLIGSLHSFFLPTWYELTSTEIIVKTLFNQNSRPWQDFHSFYPDKNGVLLSPFSQPSRLENFRGVYIRFSHNRDRVTEFVKGKIEWKN